MKVAVVIPARNEAASIAQVVQQAYLVANYVIVANDGSTDDTGQVAHNQGAQVVDVPPDRYGLGGVYRHGLLHALKTDADWIFEMDAGGSHSPADLPAFRDPLEAGYDIVYGRRFGRHAVYDGPWQRVLLSWAGTVATNLRTRAGFADATSGYIAYTRRALLVTHSAEFRAAGHFYQTEVRLRALRAGLTWAEVPITFHTTKSSLRWRAIAEAAWLAATG